MKISLKNIILTASAATLFSGCISHEYDVCIYGGTSAAVTAAYSAAQMGMDVVVVSPDIQLGGLSSGGLGFTDIGNKQVVTGVAKRFYRRIGEHYGRLEQWVFEPHVAEDIFEDFIAQDGITLMRQYRLVKTSTSGGKIRSITARRWVLGEDGKKINKGRKSIKAKVFIDCSYQGDLMAQAGVSYAIGRESNDQYGEDWNGIQILSGHQFPDGVDPFVVKGDPESGLLWGISDAELGKFGTGDDKIQAYNYRICLTDSLENQIPITEPEGYDPAKYELLVRLFEAQKGKRGINDYFIWSKMPGRKTDVNNRGAFSTDMIGMNYRYVEGSWETRDSVEKALTDYTKGLLWFYVSDPRVPEELSSYVKNWGYPKDEFTRTGNWTPQMYVREARRMVGRYVVTQEDCDGRMGELEDAIAYAAYTMDSHNCQRIVIEKKGKKMVKNEGNVEVKGGAPYPIPYRSITPKEEECTNLLVPVCLSASHIAYGSIRMEPVFMVLGQAAGIAASLAVGKKDSDSHAKTIAVQKVNVSKIQEIFEENPYMDGSEGDIIIDDNSWNVGIGRMEVITCEEGWYQKKSRNGYGPTFLQFDGNGEIRKREEAEKTAERAAEIAEKAKNGEEVKEEEVPDVLADEFDDGKRITRPKVTYELPDDLEGSYDLYCYLQIKGEHNPRITYLLDGQPFKKIDTSSEQLLGQVTGDWFLLGTVELKKDDTKILTAIPDDSEFPTRLDALMLVRKK